MIEILPNTYTQLLIQFVFAVKHRECLINEQIRVPIEKYMTGIIQNKQHKLLAIYCMPDHCHILVGFHPDDSISNLARDIKANSSKWINEQHWLPGKFSWQSGYGAFSYSKKQLDHVVKYILNQPAHHEKKSFQKEYLNILASHNVCFEEQYLFTWLE